MSTTARASTKAAMTGAAGDVYVEMVSEDAPGLAGRRFLGVAVHLAAGGPCADDFQALLAAAGATS